MCRIDTTVPNHKRCGQQHPDRSHPPPRIPRAQHDQQPAGKRSPFSSSPQPTWMPTTSLCTPASRLGWPMSGPPPPTSVKASPCMWRTPVCTWRSHKPPDITILHSQNSWKGISPNYLSSPGGTSYLGRAWHTLWRRCSTRPLSTRPYTFQTPSTPGTTQANN